MLTINRLAAISLLLAVLPLYADNSDKIDDLAAERERLNADTAEIRIQIELDQERIENLKLRLAKLQEQSHKLAQQVEEEMEQYDNQTNSSQNN
ncbi:hypothetical protein MNBD_GAMMA26-1988 [hydrothermal vent metagenome]|uniref:Uncharacterized protein n=1 Tax=hydrothermal vent metagenome TaxID=652676 RepID=A0A3B1B6E8_9ZZZZ